MSANDTHGPSRRANLLVVAAWIALAVTANLLFALAPSKASDTVSALLPQDAETTAADDQIARAFPGAATDAIAYLVVEGSDTLGPADQDYYDTAVSALRADTDHVGSVLDWWSDPLTAPMGTSPDGRSATAMMWLVGEAGTTQATESLDAARSVVRQLPPSAGLRARITAPATTNSMPLHMSAWQGAAIVTVAAVIAVLLLLRARQPTIAVGIALLTAGLSLAVAWPLAGIVRGHDGGAVFTVFSMTLAAVLTIGTITASTMLVARHQPDHGELASATDRRAYPDNLPALALPGACIALLAGPLLTGPLLLARTPALQSVGTTALGLVVALGASLTLLPALIGLAGPLAASPGRISSRSGGAGWTPPLSIPRPALVTAVVLAICALPVIGIRLGLPENPPETRSAQVLPGYPLPDVVVIESDLDLRDPPGLIAIDQVSHNLMEVPGVRKVQSAAWPGGIPWDEASLTSALGRVGDQMARESGSFAPQMNAIRSVQSMMDQVTSTFNELESSMNAGLAGLAEVQQVIDLTLSRTRDIEATITAASGYLDPVRGWMGSVQDCPADVVCSSVRMVLDPIDQAIADMTVLSDNANRVAAVSKQTMSALDSAPGMMTQMRSVLDQARSLVSTLETTIEDALPQATKFSLELRSLTAAFTDTGEGGFYLSNKQLVDPSYQNVRRSMFSSDGTSTRLFVYSEADTLDVDAAARAQQLEIAAGSATKYGSLVDSQITVSGAAQVAAAVRGALIHDAVLLAVTMLAVLALVSMWRGAVSGLVIGLGVLASYLAALGISVALWQHLLDRELHASVPLVSFAILAVFGVPYLIATVAPSASTVSVRGAVAPLMALGAALGGGLVLVSAASLGALGQLGTVLVIGLAALTLVAHVCIPAAMPGGRAQRSAVAGSSVTEPHRDT